MSKVISESVIQSKGIAHYKKLGWTAIRLHTTGVSGQPDVLFLKDGCKPMFVEYKKSKGGVVSPLQRYYIDLYKNRGFEAFASASPVIHNCTKDIICNEQCNQCKCKKSDTTT